MNFLPIIQRITEAGGWIRAYPGGKIRYHVAGGLTSEELATVAASKPAILSALSEPMMMRMPDGTGMLANPADLRFLCMEMAERVSFPRIELLDAVGSRDAWASFVEKADLVQVAHALVGLDEILSFADLEVAA